MTIEIRRLGLTDTAVLDRVADDVFDEDIVPARAAAYLADPVNLLLVALSDGVVVGQAAAVLHRHPDMSSDLYIDNLGVTPAFQRQGIARRLIEALFEAGRGLGCKQAWVATETDNVPARRLYQSLGDAGGTFIMFEYDL